MRESGRPSPFIAVQYLRRGLVAVRQMISQPGVPGGPDGIDAARLLGPSETVEFYRPGFET
jgi:hypothetical protein